MKQGNQFYLEIQITDEEDNLIDISSVSKIQFTIGSLTKYYDSESDEVTYDEENQVFKIWLTEQETFAFNNLEKLEARVLFKNDVIQGTAIEEEYIFNSLSKEELDVKIEDTE